MSAPTYAGQNAQYFYASRSRENLISVASIERGIRALLIIGAVAVLAARKQVLKKP